MRHLLVALALTVVAADVRAQGVLGTYATAPAPGSTGVTLVLRKDAQGKIGGSMSGNGVTYAVQADMLGDDVAGSLNGTGSQAYFEAHRDGAQLRVIIAEMGADGKPNYAAAREVMFMARTDVAQAGEPAMPAQPARPSRATGRNPLASPGATDHFTGTFAGADVTLTLGREGAGYVGTIHFRGEDYPATAHTAGKSLAGSFDAGGQQFPFSVAATGEGKYVNLTTGGTTYMLARGGVGGAANPLAGGDRPASVGAPAPSPARGSTAQGAMGTQDRQLHDFLVSTAWCSFSYSGGSTYTGGSAGTTRTTRVVFAPNGTVSETRNGETTTSGDVGQTYGSSSGGQQGRWKVEGGQLLLSSDGMQWAPQALKIERNSNGYPIVTSGGREYMTCQ